MLLGVEFECLYAVGDLRRVGSGGHSDGFQHEVETVPVDTMLVTAPANVVPREEQSRASRFDHL